MSFVLRLGAKRQGKPLWFCKWTPIGPRTTADPKERAEFETREEAERAIPFHVLSTWSVEEIVEKARR